MGTARNGQMVSRFNKLGWGVMVDGIMPSRGSQACAYRNRCPKELRDECVAGTRCRHESILLSGYISSATKHYAYAKSWLNEGEYQQTIKELGVISLQLGRLSARLGTEGHFDDCDSGISERLAVGLRYATALARRQSQLMHKLLDEQTAAYWASV